MGNEYLKKLKTCLLCQDLLACLSSTEVQQMLDELASDPDDKHVPPSVRLARCVNNSSHNDVIEMLTGVKRSLPAHLTIIL